MARLEAGTVRLERITVGVADLLTRAAERHEARARREGSEVVVVPGDLLQTVEVFRHSEPGYIFLATYCDSDLLRAEPFEALDLDLSEIWPEPELLPPPSVPEF